jgi:hypothetical protein
MKFLLDGARPIAARECDDFAIESNAAKGSLECYATGRDHNSRVNAVRTTAIRLEASIDLSPMKRVALPQLLES